MGIRHYENFPVASLLLPGRLRRPVETIYAFARSADDFADEGGWTDAQRLAWLDQYAAELDRLQSGAAPGSPLFEALAAVVARYALPLQPFRDLLSAFAQDVTKKRYASFAELADYCRRSANPIGRLLLHLFGCADADNIANSDRICTALQLINFLQDVPVDFAKGRIYLPLDELHRFGVSEDQIARGDTGGAWRDLMAYQAKRARALLDRGAALGRALPGRVGLELRMIVMGGRRILDKLQAADGDVFRRRPVLTAPDWAYMFWRALT
ncbi:MAG TPA: squalene synthase HpnC [Burkholderiales bacterium]|jgi:squalene synthase HpnC|nr:squalene synthase HpnC [Burkholderiales bacterium]